MHFFPYRKSSYHFTLELGVSVLRHWFPHQVPRLSFVFIFLLVCSVSERINWVRVGSRNSFIPFAQEIAKRDIYKYAFKRTEIRTHTYNTSNTAIQYGTGYTTNTNKHGKMATQCTHTSLMMIINRCQFKVYLYLFLFCIAIILYLVSTANLSQPNWSARTMWTGPCIR